MRHATPAFLLLFALAGPALAHDRCNSSRCDSCAAEVCRAKSYIRMNCYEMQAAVEAERFSMNQQILNVYNYSYPIGVPSPAPASPAPMGYDNSLSWPPQGQPGSAPAPAADSPKAPDPIPEAPKATTPPGPGQGASTLPAPLPRASAPRSRRPSTPTAAR
ncbi:hypothetical protein [Singulisphaera sp. PoT]|uniref:hypothetical protein n=1 Tax=Singulisphaera sp. PoT TaxID=3411797 RepID=UPI003BF61BF1